MSTSSHRAQDDGTGHCTVCPRVVRDYGHGPEHLRGTAGRREREALGLPALKKPPVAGRVADLQRTIDLLERDLGALEPLDERLIRIEQKLDHLLELLERPPAPPVNHRRIADGGEHVRRQRRRKPAA